ncbi:MAG TPA: RNA polymerase sigma factor [Candidatus Limnocylindrales bacterium]|jgi:RNA polymerase sigma-70 factor (ECF subfamily)|nr:RNA polymerase sigma factor [Candidatus Limnocylindrales bacterium]
MSSDHFEQIVTQHYEALYRFAFSLTRTEAEAGDLTQEAFSIWSTRGHQLRDRRKVKSWLFTVLHREFLKIRKKAMRFPHFELSDVNEDLPIISPEMVNSLDGALVLELLGKVQEPFQAALNLFYMEDYSYKEIADILEVPVGTVRSRISRGIAQLQQSIVTDTGATSRREMPVSGSLESPSHGAPNGPSLFELRLAEPACG